MEIDSIRQTAALDVLLDEASRVRKELEALIKRHVFPDGVDRNGNPRTAYYGVAIPELENILNPGSAPMYPADQGHGATCSTCCPEGNGAKWGKPWPLEGTK